MAKITLEKIALDIGVSKVAVYKALNNQKGVSEALREKIKTYASSLGYTNKSSLIDLKDKKFIYFVNRDFFLTPSEQFYSTIFYFLSVECGKVGSMLQIAFLEPADTVKKMSEVISSYKPLGVFIAGEVGDDVLKYTESANITSLFLDYYSPFYNCNYLYCDNYHLSYSLTKHLISKGHCDIGFVGDISKTSSIADRYFGYLKALNESGIQPLADRHINNNLENSGDIVNFPLGNMPTAFICHCDAAAQRIYTALALKGLKIPEDISVISFDNTSLCESLIPNLTSAGPQKDYFAKKAFAMMTECLNNKNKISQKQIKTQLSERASVKDLKKQS